MRRYRVTIEDSQRWPWREEVPLTDKREVVELAAFDAEDLVVILRATLDVPKRECLRIPGHPIDHPFHPGEKYYPTIDLLIHRRTIKAIEPIADPAEQG